MAALLLRNIHCIMISNDHFISLNVESRSVHLLFRFQVVARFTFLKTESCSNLRVESTRKQAPISISYRYRTATPKELSIRSLHPAAHQALALIRKRSFTIKSAHMTSMVRPHSVRNKAAHFLLLNHAVSSTNSNTSPRHVMIKQCTS